MIIRHAACLIVLALPGLATAGPVATVEPRAVVELFTSQGCSSCPAADRLIGQMAQDPSLVVMSLAVDYWDYLGWKDTLALHAHTIRERAYSEVRGDREVYTPQVVVNGAAAVVGSDKAAIEKAIVSTDRNSAALTLPVSLQLAGDRLNVEVPDAKDQRRSGEVWLCPMTGKVTVNVDRGENNGHTLTYYNVVRRWVKLGDWNGKAQSYSAPLGDFAGTDIDSYAVLLQSGGAAKPGVVLGAAVLTAPAAH